MQYGPYAGLRVGHQLMFPEAQRGDAPGAQDRVRMSVALPIPANLCTPKKGPRLRNVTAPIATVPEASIDENCNLLLREEEVRPAGDMSAVHSPSGYSGPHERKTEPHLSRLVAATLYCRHGS